MSRKHLSGTSEQSWKVTPTLTMKHIVLKLHIVSGNIYQYNRRINRPKKKQSRRKSSIRVVKRKIRIKPYNKTPTPVDLLDIDIGMNNRQASSHMLPE